jgi:UDP-N-acetylmuramyl-tripeptide synthetase
MPLQLSALLPELMPARVLRGTVDSTVTAVEHDSRRVTPGALFVAVPGENTDGHRYLSDVAARGAAAVLIQEDRAALAGVLPAGIAVVAVPDSRRALSSAAAWFYGHPSREITVVGVTGTDGKTTVCHMATSVYEAAGAKVGRLGTVDVYLPGEQGKVPDRMSTPEAPEVQRLLRRMVDAGCDVAIVESTSHGLAQSRLTDVAYDVAVCTNITGDHLDFHKTFEAYRDAKAMLFSALDAGPDKGVNRAAVVNGDDPSANFLLSHTARPGFRYGFEARELDVVAHNVHLRPDGSGFRLVTPVGRVECQVHIPALFNVANAMAAATAGLVHGLKLDDIAEGLARLEGVPGRMERVVAGQPFEIVVDYAHTGDALRKVLSVLREVGRGRLIVVVGAAGERDPGRRYGVGRAAAEGADFAIFTSEDPRREDPGAIVREIGTHAAAAGRTRGEDFLEIEDRREAIREALRRARAGDIVVLAGKGHEQTIEFDGRAEPWDDRAVAREELAAMGFFAPRDQ